MPKLMKGVPEYSLFDTYGLRKYLNVEERKRFYSVVQNLRLERRLFCLLLYWSGVRISEALNLKVEHIDFSEQVVIIKSLKKRAKVSYRQIPLPSKYLHELKPISGNAGEFVWSFSRSTAGRIVKMAMAEAKMSGSKSCARGLRHSFAVNCIMNNVPLTLIQKWMGHASITTTAIYLNVLGPDERNFARRTWES